MFSIVNYFRHANASMGLTTLFPRNRRNLGIPDTRSLFRCRHAPGRCYRPGCCIPDNHHSRSETASTLKLFAIRGTCLHRIDAENGKRNTGRCVLRAGVFFCSFDDMLKMISISSNNPPIISGSKAKNKISPSILVAQVIPSSVLELQAYSAQSTNQFYQQGTIDLV